MDKQEIKEFFEGLSKTLVEAITPAAPVKKDGDDEKPVGVTKEELAEVAKRVGAIEAALTSEEPGSFKHVLKGLFTAAVTDREALEKMAENIRTIAGSTVVKQSKDDDPSDDPNKDKDPETLQKAADVALFAGIAGLTKAPVGTKLNLS